MRITTSLALALVAVAMVGPVERASACPDEAYWADMAQRYEFCLREADSKYDACMAKGDGFFFDLMRMTTYGKVWSALVLAYAPYMINVDWSAPEGSLAAWIADGTFGFNSVEVFGGLAGFCGLTLEDAYGACHNQFARTCI